MASNTKRTIKISEEAYQALSYQSELEKKSMEEIASALICAALIAAPSSASSATPITVPTTARGEVYDGKTGERIFRG